MPPARPTRPFNHPLPHHLHQILPVPVLQHRPCLALQLLGADPAGPKSDLVGAGYLQALALFQRGDELARCRGQAKCSYQCAGFLAGFFRVGTCTGNWARANSSSRM